MRMILTRHAHGGRFPDRNGEEHNMGTSDFAHTVVPSAEDVLEELLAQNPADQRRALRAAFNLGRAHELSVQAHRAARALEELAEPDKPSRLDDLGLVYPDWGQGGSYEC